MSAPVLVTGAAGFIGSHVSRALRARGASVVGIDNFHSFYDPARKRAAAADAGFGTPGMPLVELDITDAEALRDLVARVRPEGIIHLAARAGVRPSIDDPVGYAHTNVLGTASVLDAASRARCARVVLASSSSVYGNCPSAPFHEDLDVSAPISPYAATKRANELQASTHHHLTSMPVACLRFFTVYGPGQRPDLAIEQFLHAVRDGRPVSLFGDGSTSRDYTFIDDIVAGVLAAWDRIDAHGFRVWNLGSDAPVTLRDLLQTIREVTGRPLVATPGPARPGDVERTWADLTRVSRELGYRARTTLREGIARQWERVQRSG